VFVPTGHFENIEVHEGLYKIFNGNINLVIENPTDYEQEIEIDNLQEETIDTNEVRPFHFPPNATLKNLNNLIRMEHMNAEERHMIIKTCKK